MFWGITNHSMQLSSPHDFSFSRYCSFSSKLDCEGAFPKSMHPIKNVHFNINKLEDSVILNTS